MGVFFIILNILFLVWNNKGYGFKFKIFGGLVGIDKMVLIVSKVWDGLW